MTIDEAIVHAREVADNAECVECAEEHEQLAEWLEELKFLRTTKETMCREIYNQALEDFKKELIKIYDKRYMHDIYPTDINTIVESLKR